MYGLFLVYFPVIHLQSSCDLHEINLLDHIGPLKTSPGSCHSRGKPSPNFRYISNEQSAGNIF